MKIRAVIIVVLLLMLIFCSANQGQAAKSNLHNIHFIPPVGEHPWQHGGAPDPGEDSGLSKAPSQAILLTILPNLRVVVYFRLAEGIADSGRKPTSVVGKERGEDHFAGAK
jgi:hypothetical protein